MRGLSIIMILSTSLFSRYNALQAEGIRPAYLSVALNAYATAKPLTGLPQLFKGTFHPGVTFSTGFNWKKADKHAWMQSFKFGFFSHRYIQHSFPLYTEFGYRYTPDRNWGFSIAAGGGYLHMIPGSKQYRRDDEGNWKAVRLPSRPQGLLSISLGIDWRLGNQGNRGFVRYQNMLQVPFIPDYVPLLPYNVLHAGLTVPLSQLKKGGKHAR